VRVLCLLAKSSDCFFFPLLSIISIRRKSMETVIFTIRFSPLAFLFVSCCFAQVDEHARLSLSLSLSLLPAAIRWDPRSRRFVSFIWRATMRGLISDLCIHGPESPPSYSRVAFSSGWLLLSRCWRAAFLDHATNLVYKYTCIIYIYIFTRRGRVPGGCARRACRRDFSPFSSPFSPLLSGGLDFFFLSFFL
jgi:hypothetical protein